MLSEQLTRELQLACEAGDLERTRQIVAQGLADYVFPDGTNALYAACRNGSLAVIRFLVTEVNLRPMFRTSTKQTALFAAASGGHLHVVQYLVEQLNLPFNDNDREGNTPAYVALKNGRMDIVRYLSTRNNATPCWVASLLGDLDGVTDACERLHNNPRQADAQGSTPVRPHSLTDVCPYTTF